MLKFEGLNSLREEEEDLRTQIWAFLELSVR